MQITKQQARHFILSHQGLWPPYGLQGKPGVLEYMRRAGCIQFDPLNIVGHNSDLVLQARVDGFRPRMLQEMLYEDRNLVDGWDKNMSIYCVEDWPYFTRIREADRDHLSRREQITAALPLIREAIETRGPLSSIDLKFDQTVDWSWAPTTLARAAMESMYFWGELVIHHKINTRRVFDFAHRHIPAEILAAPDPNRTVEQYQDWYVKRRIGSVGLLWAKPGDAWLGMSGIKTPQRKAAIARLLERGEIREVTVEDMAIPLYLRTVDGPRLEKALAESAPAPEAAILAPLDNLLWDRRLVKELFDFDYTWEVYKPASQRIYGYYVLPVLYGERFIARFEPGRDKKNGTATIKDWWWEPGIEPTPEIDEALQRCFRRFLGYLGASSLEVPEAEGLDWVGGV